MNRLQKRMIKLLNETANHYNSNNRSMYENNLTCVYIPHDTTKSEGCAIGRKLPKASKALVMKYKLNKRGVSTLIDRCVPLGKVLTGIPIHLLAEIQNLHDNKHCWDKDGLSVIGVRHVQILRERIEDNCY